MFQLSRSLIHEVWISEVDSKLHTETFTPATPPIVIAGIVNADAFWDSMHGVDLVHHYVDFVVKMRGKAETTISVREGDEDGKNLRLSGRNLSFPPVVCFALWFLGHQYCAVFLFRSVHSPIPTAYSPTSSRSCFPKSTGYYQVVGFPSSGRAGGRSSSPPRSERSGPRAGGRAATWGVRDQARELGSLRLGNRRLREADCI